MTQIMAKGEEYSMHLEDNVKSFAGWKVYRAEHRVQVVLFGDNRRKRADSFFPQEKLKIRYFLN